MLVYPKINGCLAMLVRTHKKSSMLRCFEGKAVAFCKHRAPVARTLATALTWLFPFARAGRGCAEGAQKARSPGVKQAEASTSLRSAAVEACPLTLADWGGIYPWWSPVMLELTLLTARLEQIKWNRRPLTPFPKRILKHGQFRPCVTECFGEPSVKGCWLLLIWNARVPSR